jgi:opacity protein-like surface antigen
MWLMRPLVLLLVTLGFLASASVPARAQGYLVPAIGWDFGGDAGDCRSPLSDCTVKRVTYDVTAGYLAHGIFGFEEDLGYAPDFFGKSAAFGDNSVLTLMSNLVVSVPAGPVRTYVSGGVGLFRTKVSLTGASLLSLDNRSFGYDVGGGVMLLLPHHLGLRGDFRHIRSSKDFSFAGFTLPNAKLNFSRLTIGLVLH